MRRIRKVTLGILFLVPLLTFGAINAAASNGPPDDKGKPAEAAKPSHPDKPGQAKKADSESQPAQDETGSQAETSTSTKGSSKATASVAASATTSSTAAAKAASSSSGEQKTHPPGNNGTVKIDGMPWDSAPNNEPHVGCIMQIDFYGYEQGPWDAYFELGLHAPTGSGYLGSGWVYVGEDANGGGTDLDGSVTYDLRPALAASGVQPHPKQGYHVRLTVEADAYSIGADVKHKMFWVNCGSSTTQGGNQVTPTPTPGGKEVTPTPTTSAGANVTPSPTGSGTVLGATVTPTVTAGASGTSGAVLGTTVTPGTTGGLAFTGGDVVVPLIAALAFLLAAAAGLRLARKLDRTG